MAKKTQNTNADTATTTKAKRKVRLTTMPKAEVLLREVGLEGEELVAALALLRNKDLIGATRVKKDILGSAAPAVRNLQSDVNMFNAKPEHVTKGITLELRVRYEAKNREGKMAFRSSSVAKLLSDDS